MTPRKYDVDASVVVQRLVKEPYTDHVRRLMRNLTSQEELWVPEFCLFELTNVLWKQVRFGSLNASTADTMVRQILPKLPLNTYRADGGLLAEALKLGLTHTLPIYDSVYLAIAVRLGYPLITVDQPQQKAASAQGIALKAITDF